ncbi:thioredoxin family protein [Ascidiimonas sp. W6]|uniref:thioredoxin family protein n=1 Tax=Ascidiimonas meishanensis TaxID=3128903 RepID=UPI0030EF395F
MSRCSLLLLTVFYILSNYFGHSQKQEINWLNFEQLEEVFAIQPKKVFIYFNADWCVYCKKMDQTVFKKEPVITQMSIEFYAVKMNVESSDTIIFGGKQFVNKNFGEKRNSIHEIPLLLASRKGKPFSLPAFVILDKNFKVSNRYFKYLSPKEMLKIITK